MSISYHLMPGVSENYAPFRAHESDAGFDLKFWGIKGEDAPAPNPVFLQPNARVFIRTGVGFNIPFGWCGITIGRSILNLTGILNIQGLIDSGYQGEVIVGLHNITLWPVELFPKQRIAQIVFTPCYSGSMNHVPLAAQTDRGANGFGSSGQI